MDNKQEEAHHPAITQKMIRDHCGHHTVKLH